MSLRRARTASLAGRIVALTLAVVGFSVLSSSGIALVGVYRMMEAEEAARLTAYRQIVVDGLEGRMLTARRVGDALVAALAARPVDGVSAGRALSTTARANVESFDVLAVLDASGTVIAAVSEAGGEAVGPEVFEHARRSLGKGVFFEHFTDSPRGRIWLAEEFSAEGRELLLFGRLRAGLRQALLNDVDSRESHRAAALLSADGRLMVAGVDGPALDLSSVRFEPSDQTSGTTSGLYSAEFGEMRGYWSMLSVASGVEWRVVVAEPVSAAFVRTRAALFPSSLAVLVAGLAAMWASTVFARRLVKPLHQLEGRARDVASGKVVGPLESDRADEIGRVADAFDAMLVRLNALSELSRLLARSSRMDEVLRGVLSATVRLLGPHVVPAVFLFDRDARTLRLSAVPDVLRLPAVAPLPADGDSWPARAFLSPEPIAFGGEADPASGGPLMSAFAQAGIRSGLAFPLIVSDEPTGVLVALSMEETEFSEAERELLWAFAAQAAMAIENSRLFEEERTSRREAEALRAVAEELEGAPDLRTALDRVGSIAAELLNATCRKLVIGNGVELGLEASRDPDFQSWDALYASRAAADPRLPAVVPAGEAVPGLLSQSHPTVLLIPLVRGGVRRGMLVLDRNDAHAAFSERQLMLGATISREVSLAIENAFLLKQAQTRAITLDTIFRISQAVSSSLQSNVVLNRVLDVVQKILSAEAVSLMTFDQKKKLVVTAMARGVPDREMLYYEAAPGQDIAGKVFESGRAEVFHDLSGLDTRLARLAARSGFRSLLAVPLLARGRSTGVLSVYSSAVSAFDTREVELLQTFASQAALAIDTAELYGREHHVASVLQASILPDRLPALPGLEVACVYRPTGQEAEIGGDYYDLFLAPDGRAVLVIADVAGKGVVAATKTSMIRYSLRGMVAAGLGPGRTLSQLNRVVAETGDPSEIVTVWVGFLDMRRGVLTFSCAGHPPGLLMRKGARTVQRLAPTGPVLGAIAVAEYEEEQVGVDEGACLLLYTDGVTEARRKGRFFGEGRVRKVLRSGGTAEEMAERLTAAVDAFTGGELRDDAAVLIVRLTTAVSAADMTV